MGTNDLGTHLESEGTKVHMAELETAKPLCRRKRNRCIKKRWWQERKKKRKKESLHWHNVATFMRLAVLMMCLLCQDATTQYGGHSDTM